MKKIIFLSAAFSCIIGVNAQQRQFQKCFGGPQFEYGYAMQKTSEQGCVIGGYTSSYGTNPGEFYVVKFDLDGNKQWARTYGGNCGRPEPINDIYVTHDNGYAFCGFSDCFNAAHSMAYIVRTNSAGDTIWTRAWGDTGAPVGKFTDAYELGQMSNANIIVGGYTTSYGAGGEDAFLIKLDYNTGDTIWTKVYGGPQDEWMYYLQQTNDKGVYMCGYTTSFGAGGEDILSIKTDSNGVIQWAKTYGTAANEEGYGHCAQQTKDGGYIIISSTFCILKTDASGNITWQKQLNGSDTYTGHAIQQTSDGGYIIGGRTAGAVNQAVLVKTDSSGNIKWSYLYRDTSMFYGAVQAGDGGFFAAGQIGVNGNDGYLVKTDTAGISGCYQVNAGITTSPGNYVVNTAPLQTTHGPQTAKVKSYIDSGYAETNFCSVLAGMQETQPDFLTTLLPNPVHSLLTLSVSTRFSGALHIEIIDALGRKNAYTKKTEPGNNTFSFDMSSFTNGLYFLRVWNNKNESKTIKLIKQ